MGNQYVVAGLLVGVEVGVEQAVRFGFVGVDLDRVPVRAHGVEDSRQARAFVSGEIDVE